MLPVGRLAPSPTGALHLGHAFSFLIAWWSARSQGGSIVLRLEDVDAARSDPAFNQAIIEDLKWLGIDWDGPPIIQSERLSLLTQAAQTLLEQGDAYPCTCTRAEIRRASTHATVSPSDQDERGAPQQGTMEQPYPGTCRGRFANLSDAEAEGKAAGLRFLTRPGPIEVHDHIYGRRSFDVETEVGDFQILRRDKSPAYQLAVVVDDHSDGVTEVIRGRDLLSSAARQIQIASALGFPSPKYLHLPLICDASGVRLAKRHDALSLLTLREGGVSAEEIVTWVARAAGQIKGHENSASQSKSFESARAFISRFNIATIPCHDVIVPEQFSKQQ
jgi:glutamyl-tRNA synthetase